MKLNTITVFYLFLLIGFSVNAQEEDQPINQIQVIGSHNSYKKAIEPALFKALQDNTPSSPMLGLQYEHIGIPDQLDLGLRNLEIDVYADTAGAKYANPQGLTMAPPAEKYDPEKVMLESGFKVFHIPEIDFRSSCLTFKKCLQQLKEWSDSNPDHTPVFITLEAKDQDIPRLNSRPEKFNPKLFDELDQLIETILGDQKLITPDVVRGDFPSLETAVLQGNWPKLEESRGKFLFILDAKEEKRSLYIKNHPSLIGRVLFVNADPGTPEAAIMIRNNPQDPLIPELVKKGYIIRTRADSNTKEARANDYTNFEAAKNSGAQIITTDYYQKSRFFDSPYQISFEGNSYCRKNPLFTEQLGK